MAYDGFKRQNNDDSLGNKESFELSKSSSNVEDNSLEWAQQAYARLKEQQEQKKKNKI